MNKFAHELFGYRYDPSKYEKSKYEKQKFLYKHPDGTYTIGKGKFMITNFKRNQIESLKSEIEAELYQNHADQWEKEHYG